MVREESGLQVNKPILDMSLDMINSVADELCRQADQSSSVETGSYQDFLDTMKKGHERLLRHTGARR